MLGQVEVFHNGHVRHDGVLFPVGRQHGNAVFHKSDDAAVQRFPADRHVSALGGENTEHGLHQLTGAAAGKAREGDDLTPADSQIDVVEALTAVVLQVQDRLAELAREINILIRIPFLVSFIYPEATYSPFLSTV